MDVCFSELNECESQPCLNGGVCVDGPGYYNCTCIDGYEGGDCGTGMYHRTLSISHGTFSPKILELMPNSSHIRARYVALFVSS